MAKVRIIAVGTRTPGWVREGFQTYLARLNSTLKVSLHEIEPGARPGGSPVDKAVQQERTRLLAAIRQEDYLVALDERGKQMSTRELASWLALRLTEGRDLAFVIGGPDGLAPELLARSDLRWSLSRLTLPHALVRVVLAEQLYRAHGVLTNHPYHRD